MPTPPVLFGDVHISELKAGAFIKKKNHRGVEETRQLIADADIPTPTRHTNEAGQTGDLYEFKHGRKSFINDSDPLEPGYQLVTLESKPVSNDPNTPTKTMWHHTYAKPDGMVPDIDLVG